MLLSQRIGIAEVQAILQSLHTPEEVEEFIAFTQSKDPRIARNAAWVMTHFDKKQADTFPTHRNQFIDLIMTTDNIPLRRLLLNIIERLPITEEDIRTDFLDFCLTHMVSPAEPVGVQALCMKLAYAQCRFYPELLHEFHESILMMQGELQPGIKSLRDKLKKKSEK